MTSTISSSSLSNRKRALLIGNNDYKSKTKLQFCVNDAEDLGKKLSSVGFEVNAGMNQTYEQLDRMIEEFNTQICPGDLVLFFFAGYGCQWNRQDVLIPIDNCQKDDKMDSAIDVQITLQKIQNQRPSALIVFLNYYCPDNAEGFSNIKPVRDSFIIYSCDADRRSRNDRNSLFTTSLLKYITEPNLTIDEIIYDVFDDFMEETNSEQCPVQVSALRKEVYLNQSARSGTHRNHFCSFISTSSSLQEQNISSIASPINIKWMQYGIVVAGGNDNGNELNQLSHPQGVCLDDEHECIYVADTKNHRILRWKFGADCGEIVAGGNGDGNQMNQLSCPRDVILDKKTDSLIICDYGNRRLVRWPRLNGQTGQIVLSDIDCSGLTMDSNGNIYVSDYAKSEVRRWREGETDGVVVAGGNGKGREYDKLRFPTYIYVDDDETIYISDSWHHRVMKWIKDATEGILVAGKKGVCNIEKELRTPQGILVDPAGHVYVADSGSHRIMCWPPKSKRGYAIITGNGEGQQLNQFSGLRGLAVDRQNNFYVVDCYNNRVLKFEVDQR